MNNNLLVLLQGIWMKEKEASIYLAILELWTAPASKIARKLWIKRVTCYAIIQEMTRKGFLYELDRKWTKSFHVVDPEKLVAQQKVAYEMLQKSLPEFAALADVWWNKPRLEYFEGVLWIEEIYNDMLTTETDILAFVWLDEMSEELQERLFQTHVKMRTELGILAKVIASTSEKNKTYKSRDAEQMRETVIIDNPVFWMHNEIDMYGPNKVSIIMYSWEEMSGVIIHSKKFYETLSSIFNLLRSNYS